MSCIVEDEGGSSLVETKRGKLSRDATIIELATDGPPREAKILLN